MFVSTGDTGWVLDQLAASVRAGSPGELCGLRIDNSYQVWEPSDPAPFIVTGPDGEVLWTECGP